MVAGVKGRGLSCIVDVRLMRALLSIVVVNVVILCLCLLGS